MYSSRILEGLDLSAYILNWTPSKERSSRPLHISSCARDEHLKEHLRTSDYPPTIPTLCQHPVTFAGPRLYKVHLFVPVHLLNVSFHCHCWSGLSEGRQGDGLLCGSTMVIASQNNVQGKDVCEWSQLAGRRVLQQKYCTVRKQC